MMRSRINTAIIAALQAGKEILEVYKEADFQVSKKEDNSPLTIADKRAHKKIMEFLLPTNIPILSEEGAHESYEKRKNWKDFWLVDPLDGTKEFIKRNGEFTVNIALINNGKPVGGVIFVPVTSELYFGTTEDGAFKIEDFSYEKLLGAECFEDFTKKAQKLPITNNQRKYTIVGSRSHMSGETKNYFQKIEAEHEQVEIISKGSSLKICMLAEGKADIYPRFAPTMEWDTGAGHAILCSAGGKILNTYDNSELVYNKADLLNPFFIAFAKS